VRGLPRRNLSEAAILRSEPRRALPQFGFDSGSPRAFPATTQKTAPDTIPVKKKTKAKRNSSGLAVVAFCK